MKTFRPLPVTVCPSNTSICTYPSCNCAVSFAPNDFFEPTAKEKYDYNYDRIFSKENKFDK